MPSIKLTAMAVANAKPPASGRIEYWDAALPGFGLRVTDKGAKSWTVLFRAPDGQQRRVTLGKYPILPLADARDLARDVLLQVEKGIDPAARKAEERRLRSDRSDRRFQLVVEEFIERHAKPNNRGWQRQDRDLRREFLPYWKNHQIASIGRRDILDVLDRISDRTSPRRANRYLALVKKLFGWCVNRGYLEASPASGIKPPGREVSRDRVLSAGELRVVWRCCEKSGWPFGDLFRLLILTAQRLGEVSAMRWPDIDLTNATWTVPGEVAKNGAANEVPLSPAAVAILKTAPPLAAGNGYVFPALNGSGRPVSGFSNAKSRLDRIIAAELAATVGSAIPQWRIHDLRRSAASGMAQLGIAPHVIEKVLNHAAGSLGGVAGVYNRFGYGGEKRHALESWAAFLLLSPQPPQR
jgi:integrase